MKGNVIFTRKKKRSGYTCIPNETLRDPELGPWEMKILVFLLSQKVWTMNYRGLMSALRMSKHSIEKGVQNLKRLGYISGHKQASGLMQYEVKDSLEEKIQEKPEPATQEQGKAKTREARTGEARTGVTGHIEKNKSIEKTESKEKGKTPAKGGDQIVLFPTSPPSDITPKAPALLGEFENVKLTDSYFAKLTAELGPAFRDAAIEKLSSYKASSGKPYKDDGAAIRTWVIGQLEKDGWEKKPEGEEQGSGPGECYSCFQTKEAMHSNTLCVDCYEKMKARQA